LQQGDCVLKTALVIIALHCLEVHVQGEKPGVNQLLISAKGAFVRGGCLGFEQVFGFFSFGGFSSSLRLELSHLDGEAVQLGKEALYWVDGCSRGYSSSSSSRKGRRGGGGVGVLPGIQGRLVLILTFHGCFAVKNE
jgi:hypothetical protein